MPKKCTKCTRSATKKHLGTGVPLAGGMGRRQADQVGEVHPLERLVEVSEVAVHQDLGPRPRAFGLLREQVQDLLGLFEEARLLGFASAEVHHQL